MTVLTKVNFGVNMANLKFHVHVFVHYTMTWNLFLSSYSATFFLI